MTPHGIGPEPEGHFAGLAVSMQIEPRKDGCSLGPAGHVVPAEVAEAFIVLEHDTAILLAVPQAGLGLDAHILARPFGQQVVNMGNQCFTASAAILAHLLFSGISARRTKYQGAHGAC